MYMHDYEFEKSTCVFSFNFCTLSGIIRHGLHDHFNVMFPIYEFGHTIFRSLGKHISEKGVVENAKVTSHYVDILIIC